MAVELASSIHNLLSNQDAQLITHRNRGDWFRVDHHGHLEIIDSWMGKFIFWICDLFTCGAEIEKVSRVVNSIFNHLTALLEDSPYPLCSDLPIISEYRDEVNALIEHVSPLKNRLSIQHVDELRDMFLFPEISEARIALRRGITPTVVGDGINGTYFMNNRRNEPWGVFKPKNQEAGTQGNRKIAAIDGQALGNAFGIRPGTSYLRERAAYLLDDAHFSGVPPTYISNFAHPIFQNRQNEPLEGSFQLFRKNSRPVYKLTSLLPSFLYTSEASRIPEREVHKIGIFDICLLNCDRHLANFLVDDSYQIYPIDHGYTLPCNASHIRFDWMYLDQSNTPFSYEELGYIARLDPYAKAAVLRRNGIEEPAIQRMIIATLLLQECARHGLTLFQIGDLMIGKGKHLGLFLTLVNQFVPLVQNQASYFETVICHRILSEHLDTHQVIQRAIQRYLNQIE